MRFFKLKPDDRVEFFGNSIGIQAWQGQGSGASFGVSWELGDPLPDANDVEVSRINRGGFLNQDLIVDPINFEEDDGYTIVIDNGQLTLFAPAIMEESPLYSGIVTDGRFSISYQDLIHFFMKEGRMATDLRFKSRAVVSVQESGVVINSNLTQSSAISQESNFNSAFKEVTGSDLTLLYVQNTSEGTIIGFDGPGLHKEGAQDEVALHTEVDLPQSIGKQSRFISALAAITGGFPVSQVQISPNLHVDDEEPVEEPEV